MDNKMIDFLKKIAGYCPNCRKYFRYPKRISYRYECKECFSRKAERIVKQVDHSQFTAELQQFITEAKKFGERANEYYKSERGE